VLAFLKGSVKKVLAGLEIEMCLHLLKELLKSVGKRRKVLAYADAAVKKCLQA